MAKRPTHQRQFALDLVVDLAGYADAAGFRDPLKPCGDVHAIAKDIVVVDDDVADVNADAKFDPEVVRYVGVLHCHAALEFHGATHGLHHAGKLDKHAVAGSLHNAPAMRGDSGIDKGLSERLQIGEGALFVAAHQTAVAGDIRRQYSRQPPFNTLAVQRMPLRSLIQSNILDLIGVRGNFLVGIIRNNRCCN